MKEAESDNSHLTGFADLGGLAESPDSPPPAPPIRPYRRAER
jgi:hypothetical protein